EFLAGVHAHTADRARGLHETEPFVFAERLRMHAEHPCGHAGEVQVAIQGHYCADLFESSADPSVGVDTSRVNFSEAYWAQEFSQASLNICSGGRPEGLHYTTRVRGPTVRLPHHRASRRARGFAERRQRYGPGHSRPRSAEETTEQSAPIWDRGSVRLPRSCNAARGLSDQARVGENRRRRLSAVSRVPAFLQIRE